MIPVNQIQWIILKSVTSSNVGFEEKLEEVKTQEIFDDSTIMKETSLTEIKEESRNMAYNYTGI